VLGWEREKAEKFWEKRNKNLVWVEKCLWRFLWRERNNFFFLFFFVLPEVRKKNPLSPRV
jgi:hypothetical protein